MEAVHVFLNDAALFGKRVHEGLPEGRDLTLVTKDGATQGGNAAVCVCFTVQLPDGSTRTAQAVTTVRALLLAAAALRGRYGEA